MYFLVLSIDNIVFHVVADPGVQFSFAFYRFTSKLNYQFDSILKVFLITPYHQRLSG